MYAKIDPSIWKSRVSLVSPSNLYVYFQKILKKEQFHIEKPEKNYNTMTYPPLSCLVTPMQNIKNNHLITIFIHDVQYHLSVLNHHISEFLKTLTQNIEYQSHISLCWPQMLPDKTGCFEPWKALRLTGPKMVSTCEKSISKCVFTSIWWTHYIF